MGEEVISKSEIEERINQVIDEYVEKYYNNYNRGLNPGSKPITKEEAREHAIVKIVSAYYKDNASKIISNPKTISDMKIGCTSC